MNGYAAPKTDMDKVVHEVALPELFARYNLVIPEIQREYVWGDKTIGRKVLDGFFADFLEKAMKFQRAGDDFRAKADGVKEKVRLALAETGYGNVPEERLASFSESVVKYPMGVNDIRPGFIYAYIPGFSKEGGSPRLTAYLIDGQQRMTTFFLMWLHLAKKARKTRIFGNAIRHGRGNMAFDFRVRPLTHEFLEQLVGRVLEEEDFDFRAIEDSTWFLSAYRQDVSVWAMVNALKVWDDTWEHSGISAALAYEYLMDHVHFWLFVLTETAQGEQLYITMNGRGKNLSEDEIVRAKVFRDAIESGHRATEVGELFEKAIDFFWTHRVQGEFAADKGMKKFFRWVFLLERYAHGVKGDFARALRNDHQADNKWFELDEAMFGRDREGREGITFDLIRKTLESLMELYGDGSPATEFLRPSVLGKGDRDASFQQDCFVLLPLLRWMNRIQSPRRDAIASFARYLRKMLSKNDVVRDIDAAVPAAMKFADGFADFADMDFLGFIGAESSERTRFPKLVLPDEEIDKARCLLAVRSKDMSLFEQFNDLILAIEDFKSTGTKGGGGGRFSADYRISGFLDLKEDWKMGDWNEELRIFYETAFVRFRRFWEGRHSLSGIRYLLSPEISGYYETNSKLFPKELASMMEDTSVVRKIVSFEKDAETNTEQIAFDTSERSFLEKHWKIRMQESDPIVLCSLALIVQRLRNAHHEPGWTKIQYSHDYYVNKDIMENPSKRAIGRDRGFFFWFLDGEAERWRSTEAIEEHLLECHKMSQEEADELVQKFLMNQTKELDDSRSGPNPSGG